jgi:hypothetical protein
MEWLRQHWETQSALRAVAQELGVECGTPITPEDVQRIKAKAIESRERLRQLNAEIECLKRYS